MSEEEIKLRARLAAVEHVASTSLSLIYELMKLDAKAVDEIHRVLLDRLQTTQFVISDQPTLSDVASDEVARGIERLLDQAKVRLAGAPKRSE